MVAAFGGAARVALDQALVGNAVLVVEVACFFALVVPVLAGHRWRVVQEPVVHKRRSLNHDVEERRITIPCRVKGVRLIVG